MEWSRHLDEILRGLSAPTPAPAGGAAAGIALAQSAALGLKVVRISRKGSERGSLDEAERELTRLFERAVPKYEEDCEAVRALLALPAGARGGAIERSIRVPLEVLALARKTLERLEAVADDAKTTLVADVFAAASLARASAEISRFNVRNNASWDREPDRWRGTLERADEDLAAAARAFEAIAERVRRVVD